jgi:hypothetical protein
MNDSTRQAQQALEAVERVQRLYAAQRAACLAQPYPSADERLERLRAAEAPDCSATRTCLAEAMSAGLRLSLRRPNRRCWTCWVRYSEDQPRGLSHLGRWMKPQQALDRVAVPRATA